MMHKLLHESIVELSPRLDSLFPHAIRSSTALHDTVFNGRLKTCAGRAFTKLYRIELNPRLMLANPQELLPTLAHELAHLVNTELFNCRGHDSSWAWIMEKLGFSPEIKHDMPVEHLRPKVKRHIAKCLCSEYTLSTTKANRVKRGESRLICRKCKHEVIIVGYRMRGE